MPDQDRAQTAYELAELPEESTLRSVTAVPADIAGRRALRVELTDEVTLQGKAGVDYVDMPTFVIIPADFKNGTIELDRLSVTETKATPIAGDIGLFVDIGSESFFSNLKITRR
jgi:hypothetical protein